MKSASRWRVAIFSRPRMAGASISSAVVRMSRDLRFSRIRRAALAFDSTKMVSRAPRLMASIPTAPVPAKRSTKRESSMEGPRTLKRVSRRRSLVGRRSCAPGPFSGRLRYFPAITRIVSIPRLAYGCKQIALAPAGADRFQALDDFCGALGIFCEREGFAARELQDFVVAQRLGDGKGGVAVLARAEKLSGTALLQILLGNLETVGGGDHGFNAGASFAGDIFARDQDAA